MGCNCTRSKNIKFEIVTPGREGLKKMSSKVSSFSPVTIPTLLPGRPYSHCNLLIWTDSLDSFRYLFPEVFVTFKPIPGIELTINLIPYSTHDFAGNSAIDCIAFIVKCHTDLIIVKSISSRLPEICIQILVSTLQLNDTENVIRVPQIEDLFQELYTQQCNLEKILRNIFDTIDTNFDGLLSDVELCMALCKLDTSITQEGLGEIMKQIDLDRDGSVNFYEFSYWWKRGRQKKRSLLAITSQWANAVRDLLPKMNRFSEKREINKLKSRKQIRVIMNKPSDTCFSLKFNAADSAKREEMLRDIEISLGLNIYECWFAIVLQANSESLVLQNLRKFEDVIQAVKSSVLTGSLSDQNLIEDITHNIVTKGDILQFSFAFEVNNESVESIASSLVLLEKLLVSPVDNYFNLSVTSDKSCTRHKESPGSCFLDSLGSGEVLIESEHWSSFGELISPVHPFHHYLQAFAKQEGLLTLSNPDFTEFKPLVEYLTLLLGPIKNLSRSVPLVSDVLDIIQKDFRPTITLYKRFMNLSLKLTISCSDLIEFIKQL